MSEFDGEKIYKEITPYARKFYRAKKSTIPIFMTEEDYIQEVALSYIKRGGVNLPYACIDVYRKFMPLGRYTYKRYLENNAFPVTISINKLTTEIEDDIEEPDSGVEISRIWDILKNDEKSRYILYEHYFNERTLEDIGKDFGVTASAISVAQKKIIEYIKEVLTEKDEMSE